MADVLLPGHEIEFTYRHWLNSKAATIITKKGIAIRAVRNRNGTQTPTGYWMVRFDGNKGLSKLHEDRLVNRTLYPLSRGGCTR